MKHCERIELFDKVRTTHSVFLTSILWKLTGERELFAEAMQNALLGMWRNVEKLNGKKAGAYIYRIALTANSKAWRNRIGRDGQAAETGAGVDEAVQAKAEHIELVPVVRRAIAGLPAKQGHAIVMRYLEQKDYGEIAVKLGCGEATARSHVSKAILALKSRIGTSDRQE
jgi:RNA polymerase sigma factor (sigma-70 family)